MTITIQKEDVIHSNYSKATDCPLARTLKRIFNTDFAFVGVNSCGIRKHGKIRTFTFDPKFWNLAVYYDIRDGEIDHVNLILTEITKPDKNEQKGNNKLVKI